MTTDAGALELGHLNDCSAQEFAERLSGVIENADWLVLLAAARRPFASMDDLHRALVAQIEALPEPELARFLSGHPELAGPEARAGTMTVHSTSEQSRLGLATLSGAEAGRWDELNTRYRARFGFPFIIKVAEHDYASLLRSFEQRLGNDRETELLLAVGEVAKISRSRLAVRLRRLPAE